MLAGYPVGQVPSFGEPSCLFTGLSKQGNQLA